MRILLVEDEIFLSNMVVKDFKQKNITITTTYDGNKALELIKQENFDAIVLDLMLPGLDGISILKEVREYGIDSPIIITSAKSTTKDKIRGIELGADDYLPKPYNLDELFVRLKSCIRRSNNLTFCDDNMVGNLNYDRNTLTIGVLDERVNLTKTEFNILEYLINSMPYTKSKDEILDHVWGYQTDVLPSHVEVYVSYIRKKMNLLDSNVVLKTIRQLGYMIEVVDDK